MLLIQAFYDARVDCDRDLMISAYNSWLRMATEVTYVAVVALAPIAIVVQITWDTESLVTARDSIAW